MTTSMDDVLIEMHDDGMSDEWEITDIEEGPGDVYNTRVSIIPEEAESSSDINDVESFTITEGLKIYRHTTYKRKEKEEL